MMKIYKRARGITLIAVVITIVVLLILAGVSIAMLTGDNGIFTMANESKIQTALGAVKEGIKLEQTANSIEEKELTPEILLVEGKATRTVQEKEEKYYMYYAIKGDTYSGMQGLGKGNISSLRDVFLIDDNLNVKYISSNGKEYGEKINDKILGDETEIRFSSKEFSEYISKISGVAEEKMKFKWMKNQTALEITDSSINSLQDLVFFPNLKKLILKNLTLENLEGIENCIDLEYYNIQNSNVKDNSQIAKLVNLKTYIDYNEIKESNIKCLENLKLEEISLYHYKDNKTKVLSKITTLKTLRINDSEVSEIGDVANLINLENLSILRSKVTSLKGIEKLKKLKFSLFEGNQISDITDLADNENLTKIDLRGNRQIDADRNKYTGEKLEKLNKLSDRISNGCIIYLDVDKLKLFDNYKELNLSSQGLTNLEPLEGMKKLEKLSLNYNNITLADEKSREILSNMQELKGLSLMRKSFSRYETN